VKKHVSVLGVAMLLLIGTGAQAGPILDFAIPTQSGSPFLTYSGGAAPLTGSGIAVAHVTGDQTPLNGGTQLAISGGDFSLTSGAFNHSDATSWVFNGGGSFSLTGGISQIGIGNGTALLFNGTFSGPVTVTEAGANFKLLGTAVLTSVNADLAAFYGLSSDVQYEGGLALLFTTSANPGDPFTSSQISSGDLGITPVPEPAGLTLAGIGVLSLAGVSWRASRRKALAV
jgi:hypothetical protein